VKTASIVNYQKVISNGNAIGVGGLFGYITDTLTITGDLTNNGQITLGSNTTTDVGGIAGYIGKRLESQLNTLYNSADINVENYQIDRIGGIVGHVGNGMANPSVSVYLYKVSNNGAINGDEYVGGVFGRVRHSVEFTQLTDRTVQAIGNSKPITGNSHNVAGVFGYVGGYITVYGIVQNNGNVTSVLGKVAGIVAEVNGNVTFNTVNNTGNIYSTGTSPSTSTNTSSDDYNNYNDVAGIVAFNKDGNSTITIDSASNTGEIVAEFRDNVAGIVGFTFGNISITTASSQIRNGSLSIKGRNQVAGLVAYTMTTKNVTILNATNDNNITGKDYVGGLFARMGASLVVNNVATNGASGSTYKITGTGTTGYVGGIVASATAEITITSATVSNYMEISAADGDYVSGIIGYVQGNVVLGSITNAGDITASLQYVGGVIGQAGGNVTLGSNTTINNTGSVTSTGSSDIGGLFGKITGNVDGSSNTILANRDAEVNALATTSGADIRNVGGVAGSVYGSFGNAGTSIATITNFLSHVNANNYLYVGGVVGYVGRNMYADLVEYDCNVSGQQGVGGVLGYADDTSGTVSIKVIENKDNSNRFTVLGMAGTGQNLGGIIGAAKHDVILTKASNYQNVASAIINGTQNTNYTYVGGIVGYVGNDFTILQGGSIVNDKNTISVTGVATNIGGIVGYVHQNMIIGSDIINGGSVYYNYNAESVHMGGIAGEVRGTVNVQTSTATVSNVGIINKSDSATASDKKSINYIAGLFGKVGVDAILYNATNTSPIYGNMYVAGIVGYVQGSLTFNGTTISNTGDITANTSSGNNSYAGGIAGSVGSANVGNFKASPTGIPVTNNGGITATRGFVGGIVGYVAGSLELIANGVKIGESASTTKEIVVTQTALDASTNIGGVAGFVGGFVDITTAINYMERVSGPALQYAGGLIGQVKGNVNISVSATNYASVDGVKYVGGIIGCAEQKAIITVATNGVVDDGHTIIAYGKDYAGGIIGYVGSSVYTTGNEMSNYMNVSSVNTAGTTYGNYVGGLIGCVNDSDIAASKYINQGNVSSNIYVGGFFGYVNGALTIINSLSNNSIVASKGGTVAGETGNVAFTGGIIGKITGDVNGGTGSAVQNLGTVYCISGGNYVGGFAGYIGGSFGSAAQQIATASNGANINKHASVTAWGDYVGGIAGFVAMTVYVNNSISNAGPVQGRDYVGGLFGQILDQTTNVSLTQARNLEDGDIETFHSVKGYIGGLIGYASRDVSLNVASNAGFIKIEADRSIQNIGGLIGFTEGTVTTQGAITNGFDADITISIAAHLSVTYLGGLFGHIVGNLFAGGSADYLTNYGDVGSLGISPNLTYAGGIAGAVDGGTAVNLQPIAAGATPTGAIANQIADTPATISYSSFYGVRNTGDIYGSQFVGGIVGYVGSDVEILREASNTQDDILDHEINRVGLADINHIGYCIGGLFGCLDGNLTANAVTTVGDNTHHTILKNEGSVFGNHGYVGGVVGYLAGGANVYEVINANPKANNIYNSSDPYYMQIKVGGFTNEALDVFNKYVGGVFGYAGGAITVETQAVNSAVISAQGTNNVAGDFGYTYVGGLFGGVGVDEGATAAADIEIRTIANNNTVDGGNNTSGVIGYASNTVTIEEVTNISRVTGFDRVSGVISEVYGDVDIKTSLNTASIIGYNYVAGMIADAKANITLELTTNGNIGNPENFSITGGTTGTDGYVSGIIGSVEGNVTLTNAYNYNNISSYGDYVAGIIGYGAQNVDITKDTTASASNESINAYNSGSVLANGANGYVGGVFGKIDGNILGGNQGYTSSNKVVSIYVTNASSNDTYSNGKIVANGTLGYVGAIAGSVGGSLSSSTGVDILQLSNSSTVTANSVAFTNEGDTGYVSGGVGYIGDFYTVTKAINLGDITTTADFVGGIIGQGDGEIQIQDVEYSANVVGRNYTAGGIGNNISTVGITVGTVTSNTDGDDYVTGYQKYIASLVGKTMGNLTIQTSMFNDMPIKSSYTGTDAIEYVAGIMGSVEGNVNTKQITNDSTATISTLSGTDMNYVGGVAGNITGSVEFDGEVLNNANVNAVAPGKVVTGRYIGGVYGNVIGDITTAGEYSFTNNGDVGYYVGASDYSRFSVVGGIIGQLADTGTAENIMTTYNITNTGDVYGIDYTAGLIAISNRNVSIANKADNSGNISSCEGPYVAGGIAYMDAHELSAANTEFVNTGNVQGTDNYVAGLIGEIEGAVAVRTMTNGIDGTNTVVSSTNQVTTDGLYVAGGIGYAHDIISISENMSNYADVNTVSTTYAAGLVGRVEGTVEILQTLQNYGKVNGVDYVAGGIAYAENTVAISSIINGTTDTAKTITASGSEGYVAGGIARGNESLTTLTMLNNMNVTANSAEHFVAGLVGSINDNDTLADAVNVTQVSTAGEAIYENNGDVETSANYAGGVFGNVVGNVKHNLGGYTSTYTNTGVINSTGTEGYVGGVAGNILGTFGTSASDQVTNMSNTGTITSSGPHVAGNVAYIQEYTYIINASNDADVTGLDYIAGIIADVDDASGNAESFIEYMTLGENTIDSTADEGYVAGGVAKIDMTLKSHEIKATKTNVKAVNNNNAIQYVGGILGAVDGNVVIETGSLDLVANVMTLGTKDITYVGGVAAYVTGDVVAADSDFAITGDDGFIGYQTYQNNRIEYIGGVFGYVQGNISTNLMSNDNDVNGAGRYVAGLISMIDTGALTFTAGANTGDVTSSATGDYVAGLIGYAGNTIDSLGSIEKENENYTMYNTGTILAKGSYVGGAIGAVMEEVTTAEYTMYNSGEVTAETG
ncbi:MAG: hypothetical protein IJW28_00500, partial [Clostridia bacterium]|nr:hypothetical protein [Clostridia bacterium]